MVCWSWLLLAHKNRTCASVPSPRVMLVSLKSAMAGWCPPWKLTLLHIMGFPSWRTVLFIKHLLNMYQHAIKLKPPSGANGSLGKSKPQQMRWLPMGIFLDAFFCQAEVLVPALLWWISVDPWWNSALASHRENLHDSQCDHHVFFFFSFFLTTGDSFWSHAGDISKTQQKK